MTEKQKLGDIVIEGTYEDSPRSSLTLKPCKPHYSNQEPGVHWFRAEVDRDCTEVWFRITWEKIGEMKEIEKIEQTPQGRGAHLVKALIASMGPDGQLEPGKNCFKVVWVSGNSDDTRIERCDCPA